MRRLRILAALTIAALAAPCFPGIGSATPSAGISSVQLAESQLNGSDYVTRRITIAPGGSTGWHWHDGKLIGVIEQGTLTHNASDCSVDGVYQPGDAVLEPAGSDNVHIGRNLGPIPVVLQVIYVDPIGKPLAEDAPNPGCDFG
jgi:quercetin dioxygenase-like cupin family protein